MDDSRRRDNSRVIRAPRGTALSCRSWQAEAALRMLMNNLDPEVAEHPDQLIVYGGSGRAARSLDAYAALLKTLPDLNEDDLLLQATEDAKRGREFLQRKDIGAENLFKAWKSYRNAWITLESLKRKPDLYLVVREQLALLTRDLNHQCAKMMLEVQRQMQFKNPKRERQTLEDVKRFFPTKEHRCHLLALQKMNEYDL